MILRLPWRQRTRLRQVLREHPLIHIAAPRLSERDLVELAESVGTIDPPPRVEFRVPGSPSIMAVGNRRDAAGKRISGSAVSFGWHSDMSYRKHPPAITFLYAVTVPPTGGDTEFISLYRLYEELDPATREALTPFDAEHETRSSVFDQDPDRRNVHPLVQRHPESGRRLLFVSPAYTKKVIGVSDGESDRLLRRVHEAIDRPDAVHRWQENDLIVWDNRAVLHRATPHDEREARYLWRVGVRLAPAPTDDGAAESPDGG
jgi:taurine dioxygenase